MKTIFDFLFNSDLTLTLKTAHSISMRPELVIRGAGSCLKNIYHGAISDTDFV